MKISILIACMVLSLHALSQVQHVNTYDDLIKFQNNLKSESANIIVWGQFGSWGKFGWDSYKNICPNTLNQTTYAGLLSALNFKLFSDSTTTYYLPISKKAKLFNDFKSGDIIKLKVRLYRNCTVLNGKVYFLIEEIL